MLLAQDVLGDSFRALRPEKLGAVLSLCREQTESRRDEREGELSRGEKND